MTARAVSKEICQGLFSHRWVNEKFGPLIGKRRGRSLLYLEADATRLGNEYLETGKLAA